MEREVSKEDFERPENLSIEVDCSGDEEGDEEKTEEELAKEREEEEMMESLGGL